MITFLGILVVWCFLFYINIIIGEFHDKLSGANEEGEDAELALFSVFLMGPIVTIIVIGMLLYLIIKPKLPYFKPFTYFYKKIAKK